MKIAFVFDDSLDKNDGIQQYIFSLANYYQAQGHEVHYLVGETKRTDLPHVHSLSRNVAVTFNGNKLSIPLWASRRRVRTLLQEQQFDVLHVQVPYHPLMAGRIINAASPKTVVFGTFHVAPYSRVATIGSWLLGKWSRLSGSLGRFDTMVSVSTAAELLAKQAFGVATAVVPNVFDYPRFHTAQPLPQYTDGTKTIVFLGRLVPRKGCLTLLQAVAQLHTKSDWPPVRVVVCGAGGLEASLRAFVAANGLAEVVEFAGRISEDDKPRYLASADIAVFPSSSGESFGIVLIEAMASGKAAVLGGDNPGYRTVLGTRPQLLFNPRSSEELAAKLLERLQSEPTRSADAAWGATESQQYDVSLVGAKLLEMYQTVASTNNSGT